MDKIVKIYGGIGNQLFQYSFGRYLEETYGINIYYDIKTFQNSAKFTNRQPIIKELIPDISLFNKQYNSFDLIYRIKRKIVHDYFPKYTEIYVENILRNDIINVKTILHKKYFDGYWQSLNYLNPIENIIRREIIFDFNLSELCTKDINDIKVNNSCSIHIRRGDYLLPHNAKIFSECGINYFKESVKYILSNNPDSIFFVFSDDINWAKEIFIGSEYNFIDSYTNNPIADLFLMSNCSNNIISNSTFSWWASWLNVNPNKIIVSPKIWFNNVLRNEILIKNLINSSHILI
jgi:hypothetical protein